MWAGECVTVWAFPQGRLGLGGASTSALVAPGQQCCPGATRLKGRAVGLPGAAKREFGVPFHFILASGYSSLTCGKIFGTTAVKGAAPQGAGWNAYNASGSFSKLHQPAGSNHAIFVIERW